MIQQAVDALKQRGASEAVIQSFIKDVTAPLDSIKIGDKSNDYFV